MGVRWRGRVGLGHLIRNEGTGRGAEEGAYQCLRRLVRGRRGGDSGHGYSARDGGLGDGAGDVDGGAGLVEEVCGESIRASIIADCRFRGWDDGLRRCNTLRRCDALRSWRRRCRSCRRTHCRRRRWKSVLHRPLINRLHAIPIEVNHSR
jgi:hypothetical protein